MLVRQDAPVGVSGSIILPQGKEEWPNIGTVIAIGSKVELVKVGDRVFFQRKPETGLDPEGRPEDPYFGLIALPEENILAVIDGE